MQLIATLGDAPTTVIAVVAILVGVLFAARGSRDKRQPPGGEAPAGPTVLSSMPVATPESEPGFVGPAGEIVGHGTIRLGQTGPLGEAEAEAEFPAQPEAAPAAEPEAAPAEPAPAPSSEPAWRGPAPPSDRFRQGTIKLGGRPAGRPPTD